MPHPVHIERSGANELLIQWSDNQRRRYEVSQLREQCPCASCREKRREKRDQSPLSLPVLSAAEAQPLRIAGMKPVGNYAYNIQFSDGHNTGIYTFEFLRELGRPEERG